MEGRGEGVRRGQGGGREWECEGDRGNKSVSTTILFSTIDFLNIVKSIPLLFFKLCFTKNLKFLQILKLRFVLRGYFLLY